MRYLILLLFFFTSCEDSMYTRYSIYFDNQTNKNIEVFILDKNSTEIALPENQPNLTNINANSSWIILDTNIPLEEYFSNFDQNTIHVFVIDQDTLNTYSWSVIRNENNIIKRYDVEITDLVTLNNIKTLVHSE